MIKLEFFTAGDIPELLNWLESTEARFLRQFAGPSYHFPLDTEQLTASLRDDESILFKVVHLKKAGFRITEKADTFIPAVEDTWKSIMMEYRMEYRMEKRDETIRRSQHLSESV